MNKKPTDAFSVGFFIVYQHLSKTEPIIKDFVLSKR